MLKRLVSHLFSNKTSVAIIVCVSLLGCAGTTLVQRQHHLLHEDSSKVSVGFLRIKESAMGMKGRPIEIHIDGEKLLDLSVGEYTFLDLTPGRYRMMISGWAFDRANYADVWISRNYIIEFGVEDSLYLLFTLEKIDFWSIVSDRLAEQINIGFKDLIEDLTTFTIPLGKNVWLQFSVEVDQLSSQVHSQNEFGTTVESVSRETAIEAASHLEPVEGAQHSLLRN